MTLMIAENTWLPMFPLNTVLFPGGVLPLRIFEIRYIDMVRRCMREELPFGICLIKTGKEIGEVAQTYNTGTLVNIIDWEQRKDGLLGIVVQGFSSFRMQQQQVQSDQLLQAQIAEISAEPACPLPDRYHYQALLLQNFLRQLGGVYDNLSGDYQDATWVGQRLSELLPMSLSQRQTLLEAETPLVRIHNLEQAIKHLGIKIK